MVIRIGFAVYLKQKMENNKTITEVNTTDIDIKKPRLFMETG